jgi:hypothetical protein
MKNLKDTLFEGLQISESKEHSRDEYKEAVKRMEKTQGVLEKFLSKKFGVKIQLNIEMFGEKVVIESQDLKPQFKDEIFKSMFSKFCFAPWGGKFFDNKNSDLFDKDASVIRFNPQWKFDISDIGGNSCQIEELRIIWFDCDSSKWFYQATFTDPLTSIE